MKKTVVKIISSLLIAAFIVASFPCNEVNAYTCYGDMTYDEVCAFWSSQPAFYIVYNDEYQKSGYSDQVKYNLLTYFKCSLNDSVWNASQMKKDRPETYNYMQSVLGMSSPDVYRVITGQTSNESLRAKLMDEMKDQAPYLTYNERCQNADILLQLLKNVGVYNKDQYKAWKKAMGGKTAFEVFIDHVLDYNDYWNKVNKKAAQAIMAEEDERNEQLAETLDAYEEQQAEQAMDMADAFNKQIEAQQQQMAQLFGN